MITAELTKDGNRIEVRFPYDEDRVGAMRTISGRRFNRSEKCWTIPKDWQSARELRMAFGADLRLGPRVREWGRREKARQESLASLSGQSSTLSHNVWDDESWDRIARTAPELAMALFLGPVATQHPRSDWPDLVASGEYDPSFQVNDVMFMINSSAPLNANHMGLGKTPETIAAIVGAGLDSGPVLIVVPVTAAEGTWPAELDKWLPEVPYFISRGTPRQRQAAQEEAARNGQGWLIINPAQLQVKEIVEKCPGHESANHKTVKGLSTIKNCPDCTYRTEARHPTLFDIEWSAIVFDEAHESGILGGKSTLTGRGVYMLKLREGGKKILLTGTPMGGHPIKLFSCLQFLNPKVFTSKWRFAEQYLEIDSTTIGYRNPQTFQKIGGIKRCDLHRSQGRRLPAGECDRCDENERRLFQSLTPYMLRRTKADVLKDLPPKQYNDIWVELDGKHAKQYQSFADEGMVEDEEGAVIATNVISEYTRLSQMSFGLWKLGENEMTPTKDSPKLRVLDEKLAELGIFDSSQGTQAVIFTQFKTIANLVTDHLFDMGANVASLTGDTSREERAALKEAFQGAGGLRVLVITTRAGGTSLTLDRASDVFFLDRNWNPDVDEQAEDRCHRASRIHQVTVHRIMTRDTIDEYRMKVANDKMDTNSRVMDLRRYLKEGDV